jgi:PIN domain nuclease of toxin-antitoxin system
MSNSKLLILDTHIWIWWVKQDSQLSRSIEKNVSESTAPLAISSVSIYEAVRQIKRGRI